MSNPSRVPPPANDLADCMTASSISATEPATTPSRSMSYQSSNPLKSASTLDVVGLPVHPVESGRGRPRREVAGHEIGSDEPCRLDDCCWGQSGLDAETQLLEHQRVKLGGLLVGRGTRRSCEHPERR
jgi:hypothetical protein